MKLLLMLLTLWLGASANGLYALQYNGVEAHHAGGKTYRVARDVSGECQDVPIVLESIWQNGEVPDKCRQALVKTVGLISPMKVAEGVDTYGELEVLGFIQRMQQDKKHLLVDSRGVEWYEHETIPGSVNIWYAVLKKPAVFPDEFREMLAMIGVEKSEEQGYDFSAAATLLMFCNGPWCGQSPMAIRALLEIGYPPEKIKWYRGGMHDWKSLSMTTTLSR